MSNKKIDKNIHNCYTLLYWIKCYEIIFLKQKKMFMKKKLVSIAIMSILTISSGLTMQSQKQLSCGGDYKLPNGQIFGQSHNDIERAGVVLCKDYGRDDTVPNDRFSIILGRDKNLNIWLPQAGKVEQRHKYTSETASAELEEETGGLIKYKPRDISGLPYVYSEGKQLYFLINSNDSNISVRSITNSTQAAQNSPLPRSYKEIDQASAVSVVELLNVALQIKNGTLGRLNKYQLKTRTHGKIIEIDGFYMRIFANKYDEVRKIFSHIFNHQF